MSTLIWLTNAVWHLGLDVLGVEQSSRGSTTQAHCPRLLLQAPQPHNRLLSTSNRAATSEFRDPQERKKQEVTPKNTQDRCYCTSVLWESCSLPCEPRGSREEVPKRRNGLSLSHQISPRLVICTSLSTNTAFGCPWVRTEVGREERSYNWPPDSSSFILCAQNLDMVLGASDNLVYPI